MNETRRIKLAAFLRDALAELNLRDESLSTVLWDWDSDDEALLKFCLSRGLIRRIELEAIIEKRLAVLAENVLKECKVGQYADHVASPAVLAYALEKNLYTNLEESLVTFDHGDTRESFIREYRQDNLVQHVIAQLLDEAVALA